MSKQDRTLQRNKAIKAAQIVHAANGMYYDCRLSDLNSRGARVQFEKMQLIGDRVEMIIKPEGIKVLGRVAWKSPTEFGVVFDKQLSWLKKHDVEMTIET